MTMTVRDAALLLGAMAGTDPADPATADAARHVTDFASGLDTASLKGVRIGVMRGQIGKHRGVAHLFEQALADLRRAGAELVNITYAEDPAMGRDEGAVLYYELKQDLGTYLAGLPGNPPVRSLADIGAGNLPAIAGYPHLSVPMGAVEGLPVGLSIFAGKWQDKAVLEAGAAYERARTAPLPKPSFKRWGQ